MSEVTLHAVELIDWGPDANPDPDNIGVAVELEIAVGEGGAAISLYGGLGPDRRILVPDPKLRFALEGLGPTTIDREGAIQAVAKAIAGWPPRGVYFPMSLKLREQASQAVDALLAAWF